MNDSLRATAIRILREQINVRTKQNDLIRKRFGARITIALTGECAFRDNEIEALNATLTLLGWEEPVAAPETK